jgi:divalent metal cation (Fe/Co/Zn/Cd) transporter
MSAFNTARSMKHDGMRELRTDSKPMAAIDPTAAEKLIRRGLRLEYATLGWNVIGSVVVIVAAIAAGSVALAGFGLDSLIEIFASVIVVWQLKGVNEAREHRALRLIGSAFFVLAAYILAQIAYTLIRADHPDKSTSGIIWLAATFVAMLVLAYGKRITGRQLGNPVLTTEAHVTVIDAYLAGAVLVGLILNAVAGWWWADPLAGLVIVYYGFKEGWEIWHGAE